jgi:nucleolar protein 4
VTLKKRLENLAKPAPTTSNAGGLAPSHANRLIVRNLPFNVTEQDLRAVFLPYGPIYQIHIPTAAAAEVREEGEGEGEVGKPVKQRAKGFGFVWMLSRKDAERAIEGCNGKVVRAGTAEALVSDKQKKKKQKRLEKKMKEAGKVVVEEENDEGGEAEEDVEDEKNLSERVIAVDWALSKDKWEGEKAKMEQKAEEDVDMDSESDDEEGSDEDEKNIGVHSGEGDEDEDSAPSEGEDYREEPVKPSLPATDVGTTLFVRNVPFTATEDEFRTLFRAFGPLRYARITMDLDTGRSRGTGFACFWNKEDADKVIEQSDLLRKETTGNVLTVGPCYSFAAAFPDADISLSRKILSYCLRF